ncbi:MAG: hypothetical protein V4472_00970 [Pseudomonadota bacterium]
MMAQDPAQRSQRVKVGMIGLAAVLLLIGLAAAIFSTANRERPLIVVGGAHPDVVAAMAAGNAALPSATPSNEPLAELGVAPSAATDLNATQPGQGTGKAPR